ncbi:MAG: hypothetical protein ACLQU2_35190 [Candidatus Binataceae bacterium]
MEARTRKGLMPARLSRNASLRLWASRKISRITILLGLMVLASRLLPVAEGATSDAMAQVKSAVDKARKLLDDPSYKSAPESKRTELLKLLDSNFDFR